MKTLLVAGSVLLVISTAMAREPVRFNAHTTPEGALAVELTDEATGAQMKTTLSMEKTRSFFAWANRHSSSAVQQTPMPGKAPPPPTAPDKGCGFGDFFSGKC